MCLRSSLSGSAPSTVLLYVLLREPQLTPRAIPANAALPASVPRDQGSHASLRSSRRSRDSGLHGGLASMSRTVLYRSSWHTSGRGSLLSRLFSASSILQPVLCLLAGSHIRRNRGRSRNFAEPRGSTGSASFSTFARFPTSSASRRQCCPTNL